MKKVLLAHAHIFKNAGTTIDWILDRNFGSKFLDDRNDYEMASKPEYLSKLLGSKPNLKAISSHSLPLPITNMDDWDIYVIVMLRHPLLRIRSVYDFERKQNANTPGAIHAKKYRFREYVYWRMQSEVSPTIRNMQVRYLTKNSLKPTEELDDEYLLLAEKFVFNNQLVGIVERFDRSMVVFANALKGSSFDVDFSYNKQNVTASNVLSFDEKIAKLKLDLGDSLYQEVVDKNSLDLKLYEYAKKTLEHRFQSIESACEDIEHLRFRSD